jgi:hypothetical protein
MKAKYVEPKRTLSDFSKRHHRFWIPGLISDMILASARRKPRGFNPW